MHQVVGRPASCLDGVPLLRQLGQLRRGAGPRDRRRTGAQRAAVPLVPAVALGGEDAGTGRCDAGGGVAGRVRREDGREGNGVVVVGAASGS